MSSILLLSIYIDKNRKMIFVPSKKTKAGFRRASEPYIVYEAEEVNNVELHIKNIMKEIALHPIADEDSLKTSVMKKICGKKSYNQFTKEHINIDVLYNVQENVYTISNVPRLADGSYGVRKNTLSQQYATEFKCNGNDDEQIRKNFLKAYAEAQSYLYEIGELKEQDISKP